MNAPQLCFFRRKQLLKLRPLCLVRAVLQLSPEPLDVFSGDELFHVDLLFCRKQSDRAKNRVEMDPGRA